MYIYKASGFPPFFCNLIDLLIDDYCLWFIVLNHGRKKVLVITCFTISIYGLGILCFTTVKCLKDLEMKKNTVWNRSFIWLFSVIKIHWNTFKLFFKKMCPWIDVKNLKHFRNLNSYSLTYFHVYLYTYVIQIINSIHKNIKLHQRV